MADEPVIAQKGPYQIALEKGKSYAWCTCGKSGKQPFCDGSHKGSSFTPMRFTGNCPILANRQAVVLLIPRCL